MTSQSPLVERRPRPTSANQQESRELRKLLKLLNATFTLDQEGNEQENDAKKYKEICTNYSQTVQAIGQFSLQYESEREFSKHGQAKMFTAIFCAVVKHKIDHRSWMETASPEVVLHVLQLMRLLLRDPVYQTQFLSMNKASVLAEELKKLTENYMQHGETPFIVEIITEMTNIFHKLMSHVGVCEMLIQHDVHQCLVLLLSAQDITVLHCTIHALIGLVQREEPRRLVAELNSIEVLLRIIQDYDLASKKLAANLLRFLCSDSQARELIQIYDGIPILLSALHSNSVKLLVYVVWCLVQLSDDPDVRQDIRHLGGIPLLLPLLGERNLVSDRTGSTGSTGSSGLGSSIVKSPSGGKEPEEGKEQQLTLKSACCACLTELVLNDTNAQQIVQSNGIYYLGQLVLLSSAEDSETRATQHLQANAFRTLRFLFSMERNRQLFKRLFPPDLFEKFIDIGHYNRDIGAYTKLVSCIGKLNSDALKFIRDNLELTNHNQEPSRIINEYSVLELLGAGAYGSVYKVQKVAGQSFYAMKEINTQNAMWGSSNKERQQSVGDVINELTIIKEQLKHPNVVRYYKTFVEQERLYIVMDLIEGAPLGEHFTSLKEKKSRFSEDRIWHIFIQLVLALRYLHKEKRIVHRDLTPNNIMLGEGDRVTITDFGLAKVKQVGNSKMMSQVGTILYWGPELILNKPYGEKADIWAIGCILYQMCTLEPPFCSNLLSLALKIVKADYEPIPSGIYSDKVISTVKHCMTADHNQRPDIIGVAAHMADILLMHMDGVKKQHLHIEKKLEHERKKNEKHKKETSRRMQQLCLVAPERTLTGSGGAASIKESELTDYNNLCSGEVAQGISPAIEDGMGTIIANDWVTDDEPCSSGSECNSRGSSAGRGARCDVTNTGPVDHLGRPDRPGPDMSEATFSLRLRQNRVENLAQQLTLEIPYVKYSRDSGISSADQSPNNMSPLDTAAMDTVSEGINVPRRPRSYQPALGSPTLDSIGRRALRSRPNSATTATLTISQRKVREINDPILQMLHQLHKVIYITQLPPTLSHNARRTIIDRYKRALFAPRSTSVSLKNEMRKLLTGSREVIDLNLGPLETSLTPSTSRTTSHDLDTKLTEQTAIDCMEGSGDLGISYEQMQNIIERLLVESGYYDLSPQSRNHSIQSGPLRSLSMPYNAGTP